jgi:hypothetical protein
MSKQYYTAQEAMDKLGMKKGLFYYYVNERSIEKHLPPGRKRGAYFLASDIDELAASLHGFVKQYGEEKKETIFRVARPEDAEGMYQLGERIMRPGGGGGVKPELLMRYLSTPNSEFGHVLIRDGNIIGYFTLVPLRHEQALRKMRKEMSMADFKPEDLPQFSPDEVIDCFVWEVMSDPQQKHIGQYLIGKLLGFFHTLGRRGVDIQGVYAIATSSEGINLCRRMGMQVMNLPEVIKLDYMPFEIKIQESRNWFTKGYIQALKSYQKRQYRLLHGANAPASYEDLPMKFDDLETGRELQELP